jgi:hypothetical protein
MHPTAPTAAVVGVLVALSGATIGTPPVQAAEEQAYWARHQEVDYLDNLPRPYSCNDLYYKYRDVLIRLGARELTIYTYGCTGRAGAAGNRTHVDLSYAVPAPVASTLSSNSALVAREQQIEIGPGEPKSLTEEDCTLMDDMSQTVLSSFAKSVEVKGPACPQLGRSRGHHLVVETLVAQ